MMVFLDRLSARERRLAATTMVLVVGFVMYKVQIEPAATRWRRLKEQCATAQTDVMVMEATQRLKKRIESEYEGFQSLLAGARTDEEEMADLLKEMNVAATKNSVEVRAIDPLPPEYREACRFLAARIELRGRMVPFCRFSQELAKSTSLIFLRDIDIQALSERPNLQVRITVVKMVALPEAAGETGRTIGE